MEAKHGSVGILGATGFIGRRLAEHLEEEGWKVIRFSRNPPAEEGWRTSEGTPDLRQLDALVNLAGESIAQRWTDKTWRRIRASRVDLTNSLVAAMSDLPVGERPAVFLNASAVGYYPASGDAELAESAAPGSGRLEELCREWEAAAGEAEAVGVRVVQLRTGIVLGTGGDAWERLRKLFSWGLGGRLGSGEQWMPWIHLEDEVAAIAFALGKEGMHGPLNLSAPNPVTNREFTSTLAGALKRPAFFHAPGFALRLILGGFAESLLGSYRVIPARLEEEGFEFRYPELEGALDELVAG